MIKEESCHARCFARAYVHIIEVSFLGWHGTRKFMMRASANSATKKLLWDPKGSVVASSAFIPRCREKKESASDELIIHNYRRLLKQTTDYPGQTHQKYLWIFIFYSQKFNLLASHRSHESPRGASLRPRLSALPPTRMSVGCDERNFSSSEECSLLLNSAGWHTRVYDACFVRFVRSV